MIDKLINEYSQIYNDFHGNVYFAPGRVNIIGEHTDYNGGHVFPCALNIGTYLVVNERDDVKLRFFSGNFSHLGIIEADLNHITYVKEDDWANYPKGVIKILQDSGYEINHGLDLYFLGTIPNGAGLSSSASIELVTAIMLNDLYKLNIDSIDLVKFAKMAENEFVGVNCGIMDQFVIGMSKKNHAILLDANTLHYEYAPLNISGYSLVITNTNIRRDLAESKYNEQRYECEVALNIFKKYVNIQSLCELTNNRFDELCLHIHDETIRKRAKHAVYENTRTLEAKLALQNGKLDRLGILMNESHQSLHNDYEVTGNELDTLVELSWKQNGVLGSRMTGAGFGGCTISIVRDDKVESFKKNVKDGYVKTIGYEPSFYMVEVGDCARKIK